MMAQRAKFDALNLNMCFATRDFNLATCTRKTLWAPMDHNREKWQCFKEEGNVSRKITMNASIILVCCTSVSSKSMTNTNCNIGMSISLVNVISKQDYAYFHYNITLLLQLTKKKRV